ncbi:zinc finger protein 708-like [Mizuhopecten yessoensis]|uniref:zinc finger protein 708-like n=1 Tax=Mizuhopecten yessoensis TaxID=6573 RepID=UPI000B45B395|nr:zinc finger protein 708-like [Mizuhopecten yessoensis]
MSGTGVSTTVAISQVRRSVPRSSNVDYGPQYHGGTMSDRDVSTTVVQCQERASVQQWPEVRYGRQHHGDPMSETMEKRKTQMNESTQPKKGKWSCPHCDKSFEHKKTLTRHIAEYGDRRWKCDVCNKEFGRKDRLTRHKKVHGEPLHLCCGKYFWRTDKYSEYLKSHESNQQGGGIDENRDRDKENNQPPMNASTNQALND